MYFSVIHYLMLNTMRNRIKVAMMIFSTDVEKDIPCKARRTEAYNKKMSASVIYFGVEKSIPLHEVQLHRQYGLSVKITRGSGEVIILDPTI